MRRRPVVQRWRSQGLEMAEKMLLKKERGQLEMVKSQNHGRVGNQRRGGEFGFKQKRHFFVHKRKWKE